MKVIVDIDNDCYETYKLFDDTDLGTGELAIKNGVVLPDNATNGDIIKAMYPKGKVRREDSWTHDRTVFSFPDGSYFGAECRFNTDWWNESYKGGQEE